MENNNNNDNNNNDNNDNNNNDYKIEDENFYDDMPPLISIEEMNKMNINKMNKMNINNNSNEDDNYDTTFEPPFKRRCMSAPQLTSYNNDNDNDNDNKNLSYEDLILSTNTNMFDNIDDSIDYNLHREHCISILVKECRTSYESNKECPVKNCICKMFIDNYTKN